MSERDVERILLEARVHADATRNGAHVLEAIDHARNEIRVLRARLPHWRSPEERPGDGERVVLFSKRRKTIVGANYCSGADRYYFDISYWHGFGEDVIAWRPLAEVVDEIPEELKR